MKRHSIFLLVFEGIITHKEFVVNPSPISVNRCLEPKISVVLSNSTYMLPSVWPIKSDILLL